MNQRRRNPTGILTAALAAVTAWLALGSVTAPAQQFTTLIHFTNVWRYDQSGRELGTAWRTNDYDDSAWLAGPGLLGNDSSQPFPYFPLSVGTPLTISSTTTTYYFRASFQFTSDSTGLSLIASNLVDGGCVVYLNGQEAGRIRVQMGQNASTTPPGPPSEGAIEPLSITNLSLLRQGENLMAVEVHRASSFTVLSTDLMWGMKLMAIRQTPLAITNQPQDATVIAGATVTLNVGVSGGPAFYQWQRNGVNLPSGANSTYSIPNAQLTDAGEYRVIVTNAVSAATSRVATVTVFADTIGPKLLAAIGDNRQPGGSGTFGSHTINVLFDEPVSNSVAGAGARNPNNYTVTRPGTTNTVPILSVLYSTALGALLTMDATDPDWLPGGEYVLTVNHVRDTRGNAVAPNSQIAVAWLRTTNISLAESIWSFHTSAVFDPGVYDLPWQSTNFIEGPWWAQGQGLFCGGPVLLTPCFGAFRTETGFQPEPSLFRTTFVWPTNWPPVTTLNVSTIFDDGLVLYLNGVEIWRGNMPAGVTVFTRANAAASTCHTNLSLSVTNLFPGTNWLAAAVAQSSVTGDGDSVFGLNHVGASAPFAPPLPESPPPVLNVSPPGANAIRLSWVGGGYALESATNLSLGTASYPAGPWQHVPNMSNPYTNRFDDTQRYFRLKK
jgi:hypothetical protein